ncbi:CHAT domain-containing protein [Actinoplanes sp. NPDC026670]|uniref:CHAT domain-containing protein n=1 Tax=Actinoplanes sp. NPDC026670 TaxID=3154700 RepID=UPI003406C6EA
MDLRHHTAAEIAMAMADIPDEGTGNLVRSWSAVDEHVAYLDKAVSTEAFLNTSAARNLLGLLGTAKTIGARRGPADLAEQWWNKLLAPGTDDYTAVTRHLAVSALAVPYLVTMTPIMQRLPALSAGRRHRQIDNAVAALQKAVAAAQYHGEAAAAVGDDALVTPQPLIRPTAKTLIDDLLGTRTHADEFIPFYRFTPDRDRNLAVMRGLARLHEQPDWSQVERLVSEAIALHLASGSALWCLQRLADHAIRTNDPRHQHGYLSQFVDLVRSSYLGERNASKLLATLEPLHHRSDYAFPIQPTRLIYQDVQQATGVLAGPATGRAVPGDDGSGRIPAAGTGLLTLPATMATAGGQRPRDRLWVPGWSPPPSSRPPVLHGASGDGTSGHDLPHRFDEQRLMVGHFPSHAPLDTEISLTVRITLGCVPIRDGSVAALRLPAITAAGSIVTLIVDADQGVRVLGSRQQQVLVPADDDSSPVRFTVSADQPGLRRVRVSAWTGGTFLAELGFEVSVSAGGPAAGAHPKVAEIGSLRPEAGQVTLQVRQDRGRYSFQLLSDTQMFDPVIVDSLAAGPGNATEQAIHTLQELARGKTAYTPGNARRWLKSTGVALWNSLVPETVREQFWQLRPRITSFSIATGLDSVPWELLYPMSTTEDQGFLVEQFPVARRVYNQPWTPRIGLGTPRFVVPSDAPREAAAEVATVHRILAGTDEPSVITDLADLLDLVDSGTAGMLHFACHNAYRPDRGGSSITMAGGAFVPTLLEQAKTKQLLTERHPLVFVNACRSAGSIPHYTRMMGWAEQFLAAGAGAFVGTLWDVRTDRARTFAESFYQNLADGHCLGTAVLNSRRAAATADDPTWLAYTVYGDPQAMPVHS